MVPPKLLSSEGRGSGGTERIRICSQAVSSRSFSSINSPLDCEEQVRHRPCRDILILTLESEPTKPAPTSTNSSPCGMEDLASYEKKCFCYQRPFSSRQFLFPRIYLAATLTSQYLKKLLNASVSSSVQKWKSSHMSSRRVVNMRIQVSFHHARDQTNSKTRPNPRKSRAE